jgi:hypothetical protein
VQVLNGGKEEGEGGRSKKRKKRRKEVGRREEGGEVPAIRLSAQNTIHLRVENGERRPAGLKRSVHKERDSEAYLAIPTCHHRRQKTSKVVCFCFCFRALFKVSHLVSHDL